jgi:shikimate dehydrogenase
LIKQYGLIGYPLSHSFSGKYFSDKFQKEGIRNCRYDLFEIDNIKKIREIFRLPGLQGFNVTIPYKHEIMDFMDGFDHSATKVGAVNVVKVSEDGSKTGFNSDYYGFRTSLEKWLPEDFQSGALVLGIGGAAKAVMAVLQDLRIGFLKISRDKSKGDVNYADLMRDPALLNDHQLIVNTTPLGMSPKKDERPEIPYPLLDNRFFLYDLIYNPAETRFMAGGRQQGAQTKNGLEMLELQAEKSWEIWNS